MTKVPLRTHYVQKWPLQNLISMMETLKVPTNTLRINEYMKTVVLTYANYVYI